MTADEVIALLDLQPLEPEGGHWAQTWIDDHSTAIYFLIQLDQVSTFHRLHSVEVYHHYAGAPAELWLLHPDGTSGLALLGADLAAGQRPVAVVPPGTWQGSRPLGAWSLLGCTMAPGFRPEGFELADRARLLASYPDRTPEILALTHPGAGV